MTHIHEWECMSGTRICCTRCNTVSDIETAIENAEERAAKQAKIELGEFTPSVPNQRIRTRHSCHG